MLPIIEVSCSDTGTTVKADVLEQSDRRIKVAMGVGGNSIALVLAKNSPNDKYFVGNKFGMEFTTDGKAV